MACACLVQVASLRSAMTSAHPQPSKANATKRSEVQNKELCKKKDKSPQSRAFAAEPLGDPPDFPCCGVIFILSLCF